MIQSIVGFFETVTTDVFMSPVVIGFSIALSLIFLSSISTTIIFFMMRKAGQAKTSTVKEANKFALLAILSILFVIPVSALLGFSITGALSIVPGAVYGQVFTFLAVVAVLLAIFAGLRKLFLRGA